MCMLPLARPKQNFVVIHTVHWARQLFHVFYPLLLHHIFIRKLLGRARMKFLHLSYMICSTAGMWKIHSHWSNFFNLEWMAFPWTWSQSNFGVVWNNFNRILWIIFFLFPHHAIVVVVHPSFDAAAHNATTQLWL
jgi:hypothetical protein